MRVSAASNVRETSPVLTPAFQPTGHPISLTEFAADVRTGLSKAGQKELYSKYLYDDVGSALFEAITTLPEYGLTRADGRLLRTHAHDIAKRISGPVLVAELGSGTGTKTRWILSALAANSRVMYCPIDVSESALEKCWRELSLIDGVDIIPLSQSYLDGLRQAAEMRPEGATLLVLFLGSTIGNFEPDRAEEFFAAVRQSLLPGDLFYVSTDLQKETSRVIAAYNDPIGVTAAFNLNLLARINRELDGNFDLKQFEHEARYDSKSNRIEMHLRSRCEQRVQIGRKFTAHFREGETIWTESSYKFRCEDIAAMARRTGFKCEAQWIDKSWPFAQSLLRVNP